MDLMSSGLSGLSSSVALIPYDRSKACKDFVAVKMN